MYGSQQIEEIIGLYFREFEFVNLLRCFAIAPSNSNVFYAADQTNMWKTTDGGATNGQGFTLVYRLLIIVLLI